MAPNWRVATSWEYKQRRVKKMSDSLLKILQSLPGWVPPDQRVVKIDSNEICPYCKNKDTDHIVDKFVLSKYNEITFFKDKKYKVFSCHCCNAIFSWHKKVEVTNPIQTTTE